MTQPTASNTLALSLTPMDPGVPAIVDDSFRAAVKATRAGGDGTQAYFDSLNSTANFWNLLGSGAITLSPGEDPAGRPIMMAGDGNIDLRVQAVPAQDSAQPERIGILTITTREVKGTGVSHLMTAGILVHNNPSSLTIDDDAFTTLLPALYENAGNALVALADTFAQNSQVESPDVDAETLASKALFTAGTKAIGLAAALAEWGLEFTVVTWGDMIGEALGVGVLMAIPLLIEFLGHTMRHSLVVDNLTSTPVRWKLTTVHGESEVTPVDAPIPGQRTLPDPLAAGASLTVSSQLRLLHVNVTRLSSIGCVLELMPEGGARANVLVNIPWAGKNVIWAGASTDSAEHIWQSHADGPETPLTTTATAGENTVTVTVNRLQGDRDGAYFYCSSIVIAPR